MVSSNRQNKPIVRHPGKILRALDWVLQPLMLAISGFVFEDMQHTHAWHVLRVRISRNMSSGCVKVSGNDPSRVTSKGLGLFHCPHLGGWTRYVVLAAMEPNNHWHIGWISQTEKRDSQDAEIHRLPLTSRTVRMLRGPKGTHTTFFAIDDYGTSIPLRKVGEGSLGDGHFAGAPVCLQPNPDTGS